MARQQLASLYGGLVVSCQARETNPLHGPLFMAAMAQASMLGGAVGIRADGVEDISAIAAALGPDVPIMGINKFKMPDGSLFITPTAESARQVIAAGARLVAIDGTKRERPGGESLRQVIEAIHAEGGVALADCGTMEHARYSLECGADAIGTTMAGYTPDSIMTAGPDFSLLEDMVRRGAAPVFAEGRYWTPQDAQRALSIGASFVVVGTAITNPTEITKRFASAMKAAI
ncbi:MAG: N-acetylmannosamine-6-phosphate 2-epimerase [Thermomicrobiales bacterium]|nr:N-acetylmannosamine-6-phosphate 2-epimerase [Thermomicrobiales bacterium]